MSQLSDSSNVNAASQNTLSSMETVDVADTFVSETEEDEEERNSEAEEERVWGRLFAIGNHFKSLDLSKSVYTFGRGEECDYSFNVEQLKHLPCFLAYSKVHFKLSRETTNGGSHTRLEDLSSNGTFINGVKVGKSNLQVMKNNDEIALATKKDKAFVYMDVDSQDDTQFPEELRNRYTVSRVLGRGACGEVRLAFEKKTCRKFAIKVISKRTFSMGSKAQEKVSSQVMNEVNVLKALKHPCIIKVEDVIDTAETLFIVLELVEGGELFDRVVSLGQLDESTAKLMFYQLVVAIKYLHEKGITHRDLKPENVLLSTDDNETLIKVTDFGLSKFVDANTMLKTFCGTPNYLAPEILLTQGNGSYTQAIDCWSLGVILFICLGGYPPFSEDYPDMQLTQQIVQGRYTFPKHSWSNVSPTAIDLVKRLLTTDPKKRLTTVEALNHPWLRDEKMLSKAQKLMYTEVTNGTNPHLGSRNTKPKLKRQREESDETIDGEEASNESFDSVRAKRLAMD